MLVGFLEIFQLSGLRQWNSEAGYTQNPSSQNYLSLLITPEDASSNNWKPKQKQPLTSNIPPATIIEDKSLAAIFLFEIKELTKTSLFSGATLEEKPIMVMYTDAKIDGQSIKLILDTASARIITTDGVTKTPIGKIDALPIEVNDIIIPIKILIMEATQYQVLVGNDWLFKTHVMLN
ncbi:hypothetical protein G9A89_010342 [Geosiphon pyriformis]|nr:hypothetical protein G9A89_010342 [Geosiphon pyriformis]